MNKFTQNPYTFNHFKEHRLLTINMLIIVKDQLNNPHAKDTQVDEDLVDGYEGLEIHGGGEYVYINHFADSIPDMTN